MSTTTQPTFSKELQSLRGCAALVVLLGHCLSVFRFEERDAAGVVNTLLNGGGAVTFFFVLSGAVLALSLQKFTPSVKAYAGFCIRRVMRIVPMIVVAVVLGSIYCNWIDRHATYPFASAWFTEQYKLKMDVSRFVGALIGYSARPDPPLWSIFVELVGSFLLPWFAVWCRKKWPMVIGAIALLAVSFQDLAHFQYRWPVYLIDFYIGVTILAWGPAFAAAIGRRPAWQIRGFLVACLGVLLANRGFLWAYRGHGDPVTNLIELTVVAPLIAFILYAPEGFAFLRRKPMVFLGDVSYSLYLLHFPLMCLFVQWMVAAFGPETILAYWPFFSVGLMLVLTLSILGVSAITYRYIEIPLANVGKEWANCLRRNASASEKMAFASVPSTNVPADVTPT